MQGFGVRYRDEYRAAWRQESAVAPQDQAGVIDMFEHEAHADRVEFLVGLEILEKPFDDFQLRYVESASETLDHFARTFQRDIARKGLGKKGS